MQLRHWVSMAVAAAVSAAFVGCGTSTSQSGGFDGTAVGSAELGGVVTSSKGPEAGVWVIAETTDLPTKYTKIVITDEQGRYLLPELPKANYKVWVRGFGLVDSPKVDVQPGRLLDLAAVIAPSEAAAAEYYPPAQWYAMLKIPEKSEFPGTGDKGNGINPLMRTQAHWLDQMKVNGCQQCHTIGTKGTRTISKELGTFKTSYDAWARRITSGQALANMTGVLGGIGPRALTQWADWTDRIAAGELPFDHPQRPQGMERNLVLSMWEFGDNKTYVHDVAGTDKRNPAVNANGKFYASTENSTDNFPVLDPVRATATTVYHPPGDPKLPSTKAAPMAPSPHWGAQPIWDSQSTLHNPLMDEKGRVWFTAQTRPPANPDFCKQGSSHPSAKAFPMAEGRRQASMYDPATGKFTYVNTCFSTHHLIFAEDANNTLWFNSAGSGAPVLGWVNRKLFEETGDIAKAQGWTPFIIDANGNGRRDEWVEPNQPVDPKKDKRIDFGGLYSVAYNPVDGSMWGATNTVRGMPGHIIRVMPGQDANTALSEIYQVPAPGYGTRGGDIDRSGVYWVALASGHLGAFDRRKCKGPLNGPAAVEGRHCPEGWTLYPLPGPQFRGISDSGSVESPYFVFVDQFGTLGLGNNVPVVTGNMNNSMIALVDGKFLNLRVPYPMDFYSRGADGRIDNPNAGWKGKGLWSPNGSRTLFHSEGGTTRKPQVVKFQMRPNPLAR